MRRSLPKALAASVLLAAGCGRRPPQPPPERFLPASAGLAVLVPALGEGAAAAGKLLRAASEVAATAAVAESAASMRAQIGLDPFDPAGLAAAGLDPARAAGLALLPGGGGLLVLPVADQEKLDALLARLARDRGGAPHREESRAGGATVVAFRRGPGGPAALAYAVEQGSALVAPGPGAPALAGAAADRAEAESLGASPAFASARGALGEGLAALAYAPAGSPFLAGLPPLRDGAAAGLRPLPGGLEVRAALLLPPGRHDVWREVAGGEGAAGAGRDELAALPADLFAAARFGGDPAALGRRLGYALPAEVAARLGRARFDLARDLFGHLAPGAAAGLSLAPRLDVGALSRGGAAAAAADPFRLVHLAAVARVRDPVGLRASLERLASSGRALGLRVSARQLPGGGSAWAAPLGGGVLTWALRGDRLLVAGGARRLEALLGTGPRWKAPTPAAGAALASGGAAGALDVGALVAAFRALPPESFGTGPDGFVVRSLADRFLEPASRLRAASARLEVLAGAARVDVVVEAVP
jgi:hypothetical protein